eukprot:92273_1
MSDILLDLIDNLMQFVDKAMLDNTYEILHRLFKKTEIKIEYTEEVHISVIARTPRLTIRPVEHGDIEFYQNQLFGSQDVMKQFGSGNIRLYWPNTKNKKINYAKHRINGWIKKWNKNNPFSG